MNIIIPANKRPLLQTLLERIDTHYVDSVVTVLTDKADRTITFVCGQSPFCSECQLILDERSTHVKDKQFSIDGSFAKQLIHYFVEGEDIELEFDISASGTMFVELVDTTALSKDEYQTAALRRCQCGDASDDHLTYLTDNQHRPTTTASKATIERIVYEAQENVPFEFLELNKEKQYLRVQRQGEVEDKSLPRDLTLPVSLVLTPETTQQMTELCRLTSGNEIEIAQQGEAVTFKAPECTLTCSIAGVEAFYQKKPDPIRTLKYVALNLFAFKKELEHCFKHYGRIKKANDALLYLGENQAAIAVLTDPYEFVHPIHVFEVGQSEPHAGSLFRFSPRDLENIKIKNSLDAKKTRIDIFETSHGELKLGVYYSLEEKLPYDTIAIEKDERHLKKVFTMIESIEIKQGDTSSTASEQQGDLFTFDDDE
ncbi:hypothetical protein ATG66_3754 [Vibrio sp. ES.051]|uniref:hypothetical protein n=1 Tax=Vibrio sp. ES.051 TaxID=1761909 RepID=UPI000BF59895|nr:hypothetical protein [Vibrio sp. ES.051]PFG45463.1 hypothetical protein ATG66_3754 [Vibrio sp. ES.051]